MPQRTPEEAISPERQLEVINAVTEVVNRASSIGEVMDLSLGLVTRLLELRTGWVYLLDGESGEPSLCASRRLPPVFQAEPERWEGLCYCIQALLENEPVKGANVHFIACSRLYGVAENQAAGLEYHASIPFYSHGRQMGIMNVARGDWKPLSEDQLALLHTIGTLLGFAVERERLIASSTAEAIRSERERVGRELHDSVMQGLTATTLQLEVADAMVDRDPRNARERIRTALKLTQETLAEARGTVDNLAPPALRYQPVWDAVVAMCERFAGVNGMEVAYDIRPMRHRPDLPIERGLYRIVSEGLNNVVKHAGATRVTVTLRQKGDRATLVLEDNGHGFDRSTGSGAVHGYGLHSMRRRAKMMGGRFRLITAPGRGTRVEVNVPISGTGNTHD